MTKSIRLKILMALMATLVVPASAENHLPNTVKVYLTVKGTGQKLAKAEDLSFIDMPQPAERQETVFVDSSKIYQTVLGVGGALTDASAETFYKLPKDKQQEVLQAYFDPEKGIGYSLGRTHI